MPRPTLFPIKKLIGFPRETIAALDKWRRKQEDMPSRSEAIRRLVKWGLASAQPVRPHDKKAASKASKMAGHVIDRLGNQSATDDQRESRKRRLLKGPKEFRDIRSNRPKAKGR
jgi:hypothetical protein